MAARSDGSGGKGGGTLRIVGVVVLALAAIGIGAVRMGFIHLPGSQGDDSVLAKPQDAGEAPKPGASVASRTTGAAKPNGAAVDVDAPAAEPTPAATPPGAPSRATTGTVAPGTRLAPDPGAGRAGPRRAPNTGAGAAMVSGVTPDLPHGGAQVARIDEHVTYQYNALGRRDPFQSLIGGDFVGADVGGDAPPDPGGMKIVGIVWGATDQFAMVEDVRGNSYVLRKGDKLQSGYVESLRRDAVVINVTADGQSQTVVIPFVRKGDANAR